MNDSNATTTLTGSPLDPSDPRAHMAGSVAVAAQALRAIRPEQWELPTPCDGMNVTQLAEHLVMVIRRVACAGRGDGLETWPTNGADVPAGKWADAFAAGAHDVQASWPDEVLDRPTQVPWGQFTGTQVLDVYTNELVVHTWDLAQATGQDPQWDPAVLETALAAIHFQLPMADRRAMWDEVKSHLPADVPWDGDPFANAVDVPEDAPLIDRVVAWNGRTP